MPACGRVQRELADRDGHAAGSLVAEAEDPLVVGDDDEADVLEGSVAQQLGDPVAVLGRDPRAARAPDDVAELLAGTADRRRVDDRQELLEVLGEHPIEQGRVAILQRGQADVLLERVGLAPEMLELEVDLLLDGEDPVGQEPAQAEHVPLFLAEREVLGQEAAAEQRRAGDPDRRRPAGRDVVERCRQRSHPGEDSGHAPPVPCGRADRPRRRSPSAATRVPLARRRPCGGALQLRPRRRGGDAGRPSRDRRLPRRPRPPALRAADGRAAAAPDARPRAPTHDVLHPGLGGGDVAGRRPERRATPVTRSAITATSTSRSAAWTRPPSSATSTAGWPRSTRCSACARSAIARRRGT